MPVDAEHAAEYAEALATTEEHGGNRTGAAMLRAFAKLWRTRLAQEDTRRVKVFIYRRCGAYVPGQ